MFGKLDLNTYLEHRISLCHLDLNEWQGHLTSLFLVFQDLGQFYKKIIATFSIVKIFLAIIIELRSF